MDVGDHKGSKGKKTLAKEAARELARELVTAELKPLIMAQIANAKGISYMVVRDKYTRASSSGSAIARPGRHRRPVQEPTAAGANMSRRG